MNTPLGYHALMQTVAETPTFSRQADKLFNEDERRELIDYLGRASLGGGRDTRHRRGPKDAIRSLRAR